MTERFLIEEAVNAIEMFIAIGFLTQYLGCKYKGKKAIGAFLLGWLTAFITLSIINQITIFESVGTYLYILVYFIYALLFLKGNVLLKLWMSILTQVIITIVAVITIVSIACLFNCAPEFVITEFALPRVFVLVCSKIIVLVVDIIVLKSHQGIIQENTLWYKLIFIPFLSVISITMLMRVTLKHPDVKFWILMGMTAIAAANVMVYYFYGVISEEYRNKLTIKLLEQQNENIRSHIAETDVFVKEMRSVRHDLKHHLLSINNYLDSGNISEAQQYIRSMMDSYLPITKKYINTDNMAFDAIINAKITLCNEKRIAFEIRIESGSLSGLDQIDTGILFGNLLDNAIEAAENTVTKHVSLMVQIKGEYLSILVSNSIDSSVLEHNQQLNSSKTDKELHGIGLKSVKTVVEKYAGMIQFLEENHEFICDILLDRSKI